MEYCPFLFPRTICKREITREEAEQYVREGQTPLLAEFISQRGRPFAATLHLNDKGRHRFEFPPREGGEKKNRFGKKKAEATADGPENVAPEKTAEKKTEKKKASSKKASAKKAPAKKAVEKANGKKTPPEKKKAAKKKAEPKKKAPAKKKKKKAPAKKKGSKKAASGIEADTGP